MTTAEKAALAAIKRAFWNGLCPDPSPIVPKSSRVRRRLAMVFFMLRSRDESATARHPLVAASGTSRFPLPRLPPVSMSAHIISIHRNVSSPRQLSRNRFVRRARKRGVEAVFALGQSA